MILAPVMVVGAMALALYLLGAVPGHLQSPTGGIEEYSSLEEAESELGFDIAVPSYFPSYLSWPPAEIRGQLEPVPMAQTLFLASDRGSEALLVSQIVSSGQDLPPVLPWVETVLHEMPITIGGNQGTLIVGRRADGRPVNGAHWRAAGLQFLMVTVHPVEELMALARSLHP